MVFVGFNFSDLCVTSQLDLLVSFADYNLLLPLVSISSTVGSLLLQQQAAFVL
jgi:hypothetical protein